MTTIPEDIDYLAPFFPAIRHIRSVSKLSSGLAIVSLKIIIDEYGKPVPGLWTFPTITRLVPRATADEALRDILEQLTLT